MPRRLLLIIVVAAALILSVVALVWFVNRSPSLQNRVLQIANLNTNTTVANTNTQAQNSNTNTTVDSDEVAREYAARNFSESFGSGSSPDNFANWEKAKPFITESFSSFLERAFAQQRTVTLSGPYHAYLTKALVVTTTKTTATTASMVISTQRQETLDTTTTTYYQDLLLDLVKVGEEWKINAAAWKPR